ncbi:MAG TPA: carboxyl transferase domain-containing protein, partial [Casimicrobiaceae bacterium]|nr:carboxyl transferase domain-containing protein [Casimicrobiaceae bacterium]
MNKRRLQSLAPRERIAALADPDSVRPVEAALEAARPSPHLARWGIAAQDDDGVVVARATMRGAPVLIAAQDERFLRGSVGANHGDALRRLFEVARAERPHAVV